jgi:predicted acylesterase/phospholipase RssA
VFVASGGVFRGAFHIGMLAALHSANIKPDLVVGASVGTLMGGALASMFVHQTNVLDSLVDAFLRVDETVALTRTLKSAARELGLRGRAVGLSPRRVRRMLRRGARSDPGFAATGAPAALIDALSDLLMIPHRETSKIAADFVAGRVAGAANELINQLRTETIQRLDIERALLGTSLLEDVVFGVLTDYTSAYRLQRQPFQKSGIAFYGTTTNLCTQSALLLGGHGLHRDSPYDFVAAALASSAFPAVFAPRPESEVFPGTGRADIFFADGGMFDNLPFLPAIEILSRAQRGYRQTIGRQRTTLDFLTQRLGAPDLLIAGALNAVPEHEEGARGTFNSLAAILGRSSSLQHNIKIRAFDLASHRIYGQLLRLEALPPAWMNSSTPHLVDGMVNAAVLPVFPASTEHLNSTFAFCASAGLDRGRVQKSIADGCFETLLSLAREQGKAAKAPAGELERSPDLLTAKSVRALVDKGRIPKIEEDIDLFIRGDKCSYFTMSGLRFPCPFARPASADNGRAKAMNGVLQACRNDPAHQRPRPASQPLPR